MALTISRPSQEDIYEVRNGFYYQLGRWDEDTWRAAVVAALQGIEANSGGGGGSTPVTPNIQLLGANGSVNIPSGAKGWTVSFLSGTGTVGGAAVGVGFSDSDPNTLAAAIAITTGSSSSAYIRWNT